MSTTPIVIYPGDAIVIPDTSGTPWGLSLCGGIEKSGTLVPGGEGTLALTMVSGVPWGLSITDQKWYAWNGSVWVIQAKPPSGITLAAFLSQDLQALLTALGSGTTAEIKAFQTIIIGLQALLNRPFGGGMP